MCLTFVLGEGGEEGKKRISKLNPTERHFVRSEKTRKRNDFEDSSVKYFTILKLIFFKAEESD